jgi:hypothetical protein
MLETLVMDWLIKELKREFEEFPDLRTGSNGLYWLVFAPSYSPINNIIPPKPPKWMFLFLISSFPDNLKRHVEDGI